MVLPGLDAWLKQQASKTTYTPPPQPPKVIYTLPPQPPKPVYVPPPQPPQLPKVVYTPPPQPPKPVYVPPPQPPQPPKVVYTPPPQPEKVYQPPPQPEKVYQPPSQPKKIQDPNDWLSQIEADVGYSFNFDWLPWEISFPDISGIFKPLIDWLRVKIVDPINAFFRSFSEGFTRIFNVALQLKGVVKTFFVTLGVRFASTLLESFTLAITFINEELKPKVLEILEPILKPFYLFLNFTNELIAKFGQSWEWLKDNKTYIQTFFENAGSFLYEVYDKYRSILLEFLDDPKKFIKDRVIEILEDIGDKLYSSLYKFINKAW